MDETEYEELTKLEDREEVYEKVLPLFMWRLPKLRNFVQIMGYYKAAEGEKKEKATESLKGACKHFISNFIGEEKTAEVSYGTYQRSHT